MRRRVSLLLLFLPFAAGGQGLDDARALQKKGALQEAQEAYESLIPGFRGRDPASLAAALAALGQIASARGDYDRAYARATEALQIYRQLHDAHGEARTLNSIGTTAMFRADYDLALRDFAEALQVERAAGDGEAEMDTLNDIGSVHFFQASYLDALRAYREAMARVDRSPSEPWSAHQRAITIANLAALFQRLGQDEQALRWYQDLRESTDALNASQQARILTNQGVLYRRLEDPIKALQADRKALALLSQREDVDTKVGVLMNIGIIEALDMGDPGAALADFTEALEIAEKTGNRREAMQARLYRGETFFRGGEAGKSQAEFEAALAAAKELGTNEEQWKALHGLGRAARSAGHADVAVARFHEAIAVIESTRARLQLTSLRTDFLADKRDVYDALIELSLPGARPAAIFELIERSRARNFQDRIGQGQPTLKAVQERLGPDTLLVEYWIDPRQSAALWVTSDAAGMVPIDFDAAALDELGKDLSSDSGDEWKRLAALMGDRLLAGIERLAQARHLLVVPDGPLATLAFDALTPHGGPPLVERMDVVNLPTAALLLREPPRASLSWPWKRELLAFADPRISTAPGRTAADTLGGTELRGALPASADEARAIARSCRGRAELHLGVDDLKRYLVNGQAAPLLHLATHATADLTSPERSRILFSPAAPQDRADYLFLKEVYALDLRGVDLATLSACDTERGKSIRGEGVQGFSRALLSAGARASVTALWSVGDEPSRELMKQFYHELNRGVPKVEALRTAKLRFLHSGTQFAHPRFWAAFVLSGEGMRPIPKVVPWSYLFVGGILLILGGVGLYRVIRSRPRVRPRRLPPLDRALHR
jgi:CHAT domain-containing protein/tetratricopeptide (TPR) repeat protein